MRNCFAYVVKPRRLCVCIFTTTIAEVAFILCGKLYFKHFFGEFVFSSNGVDFACCSCIMKVKQIPSLVNKQVGFYEYI